MHQVRATDTLLTLNKIVVCENKTRDDTDIFYDTDDSSLLRTDLNNIPDWYKMWQMNIKASETKLISFKHKPRLYNASTNLN